MTYVVIKMFTDLEDNEYEYNPGMIFPREGLEVTEDRIKALSTKNNKRKEVFIVPLEEREVVAENTPAKEEKPKETQTKSTKK